MPNTKAFILGMLVTPLAFAALTFVFAEDVEIPHTFVANTPAVAAEVNANFAAVETAIDDNDARITALNSGAPLRTMRGVVQPIGDILFGVGFSILQLNGTGKHRVTCDTPFPEPPSPVVQLIDLPGGSADVDPFSAAWAEIRIRDASGILVDADFSFIVVGPQ